MNEQLRYPTPSILLIDLDFDIAESLSQNGFNVSKATFGKPFFNIYKDAHFQPLHSNGQLPDNYAESEIVVIDLDVEILSGSHASMGSPITTRDHQTLYAEVAYEIVDPRPIFIQQTTRSFDRILKHGGIFIVFAENRQRVSYYYGDAFGNVSTRRYYEGDNWGFLSLLDLENLHVQPDQGSQINACIPAASRLLRHLEHTFVDARFNCTVQPEIHLRDRWITIATDKFNNPVSGVILPGKEGEGYVFIFPQISDKAGFLKAFLTVDLPNLKPALFPYFEKAAWEHRSEYLPRNVLQLKSELKVIADEYSKRISELEQKIQAELSEQSYLIDLLSKDGDDLVSAVEEVLRVLGFDNVVNMDLERTSTGSNEPLREDLQIRDGSPLLLVEIKGVIHDKIKDTEVLQITKYIAPRQKSLGRFDIEGLAIVNHHRATPPLDRLPNPFSDDIMITAQRPDLGFGLLTTWNLYRLTRSFLSLNWTHEQIEGLFAKKGFIEPIPSHYQFVGIIEKYAEKTKAIGMRLSHGELCVGDRIAFELPVEFQEQTIDSLQIDSTQVDCAPLGSLVGTLTHLQKADIRLEKTRIFKITSAS